MARIAKSGLEYFPFDIDFFQDIRIRKLIKRQGGKAVTVYALLLCLIYKNGYFMQWDKDLPFIVSEMSGFEEAYISEVINTCLALGLFDKNLFDTAEVLTSKGIQVRYCNIQRLNKRMSRIEKYSLLDEQRHSCRPAPTKPKSKPGKTIPKAEPHKPAPLPHTETSASAGPQKYQPITLEDSIPQLLNDRTWRDSISKTYHIENESQMALFIERFRRHCINRNKTRHSDMTDVKRHFKCCYDQGLLKQDYKTPPAGKAAIADTPRSYSPEANDFGGMDY